MPDFDPVDLHEQSFVHARKPHRCNECGAQIACGERHAVDSYKFDGDFYRHRTCAPCVEAFNDLRQIAKARGADFPFVFGSLAEDALELIDAAAYTPAIIAMLDRRYPKKAPLADGDD